MKFVYSLALQTGFGRGGTICEGSQDAHITFLGRKGGGRDRQTTQRMLENKAIDNTQLTKTVQGRWPQDIGSPWTFSCGL